MAGKVKLAITSTEGKDTPLLVVSPGKAPVVTGNFEDIEKFLIKVRDQYENVELSTANIGDVQRIKTEMRTYRTSLEKIEKQIKDSYFNSPKKVFEGSMSKLYALIAEVEHRADDIISEEDQKRIDGVNKAIDYYAKDAGFDKLRDEFRDEFIRSKSWYNKTAAELTIKTEVTEAIRILCKKQLAYDSAVNIINKHCDQDERLSRSLFLGMLQEGKDLSIILGYIDQETIRLNSAHEIEGHADPVGEKGEPGIVEEELQEVKKAVVEFIYDPSTAHILESLVKSARKAGIKARMLNT